jgi:hypothetical protein
LDVALLSSDSMLGVNPEVLCRPHVLKMEMHLHTVHSDGHDSVAAMFEACRSAGYDVVALTDHNTVSGLPEAADVASRLGLVFVPGVEVTTFRGHAVALGVTRVPEWRDLEVRGFDALADDLHAQGGLVCVAHPAAEGSPVCSGCTWEWPFEPTSIDLWEVFSAPRPYTEVSLTRWRDVLARGGRAAPVAAGDVHSVAAAARARAATYVYAYERSATGVLEALSAGRTYVSAAAPHPSGWVTVQSVDLLGGGRCSYMERRDPQGRAEAISAPTWIDSDTRADTSVCALSVSTQPPSGSGPATRPGEADERPSASR